MIFLLANETDLQASSWLHGGFASFRWCSRRVITSLQTFPWQQGKMAALVWSKQNIFQLSAKIYVTFCNENAGIMKSCKPCKFSSLEAGYQIACCWSHKTLYTMFCTYAKYSTRSEYTHLNWWSYPLRGTLMPVSNSMAIHPMAVKTVHWNPQMFTEMVMLEVKSVDYWRHYDSSSGDWLMSQLLATHLMVVEIFQ